MGISRFPNPTHSPDDESEHRNLRRSMRPPGLRRRLQVPEEMGIASKACSRCATGLARQVILQLSFDRLSRRVVNRQCAFVLDYSAFAGEAAFFTSIGPPSLPALQVPVSWSPLILREIVPAVPWASNSRVTASSFREPLLIAKSPCDERIMPVMAPSFSLSSKVTGITSPTLFFALPS